MDLSNPEIKPVSPALQEDSLPAETQGKPKNTGVGSLSPLQRIFPTQELKQGLLHCRWILYQLSYKRSPILFLVFGTPWTIQTMEFSRPEYYRGSLSLLQGIFPTQGLNPGLLHCRQILYQLSHKRLRFTGLDMVDTTMNSWP